MQFRVDVLLERIMEFVLSWGGGELGWGGLLFSVGCVLQQTEILAFYATCPSVPV